MSRTVTLTDFADELETVSRADDTYEVISFNKSKTVDRCYLVCVTSKGHITTASINSDKAPLAIQKAIILGVEVR